VKVVSLNIQAGLVGKILSTRILFTFNSIQHTIQFEVSLLLRPFMTSKI
jgi:hypothetical protein